MARRKPVSAATKAKISASLIGNKNAFQGGPKRQPLSARQKVANIQAATNAKSGLLSPEQRARRQAVAKRLRSQARREEALGKGPSADIPTMGSRASIDNPDTSKIKTHSHEQARRSAAKNSSQSATTAKNNGVQARVAQREKIVDAAIHSQNAARGSSPEHDRFLNSLEAQGVKITGGSKKRQAQRRSAGTVKKDVTGLADGGVDRSSKPAIQRNAESPQFKPSDLRKFGSNQVVEVKTASRTHRGTISHVDVRPGGTLFDMQDDQGRVTRLTLDAVQALVVDVPVRGRGSRGGRR